MIFFIFETRLSDVVEERWWEKKEERSENCEVRSFRIMLNNDEILSGGDTVRAVHLCACARVHSPGCVHVCIPRCTYIARPHWSLAGHWRSFTCYRLKTEDLQTVVLAFSILPEFPHSLARRVTYRWKAPAEAETAESFFTHSLQTSPPWKRICETRSSLHRRRLPPPLLVKTFPAGRSLVSSLVNVNRSCAEVWLAGLSDGWMKWRIYNSSSPTSS